MKKPKRIIRGYVKKKQQSGGFKVVQYSSMEDDSSPKKRTIRKNLTLDEAEELIYQLELKPQNHGNVFFHQNSSRKRQD
jgi:hypothetical protein